MLMWVQDCFAEAEANFTLVVAEAGVADALVAALKHESRYCVAAAAAALGIGGSKDIAGIAMTVVCGAIPALVDVIKRSITPGDLEKEGGLFRR
jgi:hypothetical protein